MQKFIIYSVPVLLMLILNINSFAQQGSGGRRGNMDPKEMAERQTTMMKDSLGLTDQQLPKVEALNLEYADKFVAARNEADGDRDAMRSTMMAINKEKDVELKKILTADQWTKLEALRKEARANGQRRRGI